MLVYCPCFAGLFSRFIALTCLFRLVACFKRVNLELWSDGAQGFKNELCYVCSVLVSTHGFKNELCHMCSVLVSVHRFKNELSYMCTVLFSTHSFKNARPTLGP